MAKRCVNCKYMEVTPEKLKWCRRSSTRTIHIDLARQAKQRCGVRGKYYRRRSPLNA